MTLKKIGMFLIGDALLAIAVGYVYKRIMRY